MKASIIATVLAIATTAFAAPVADSDVHELELIPELDARQSYIVQLCRDADFRNCGSYSVGAGCANFPANLNDVVSSLNSNGNRCIYYVNGGCQGASFSASGAVARIPAQFNDALSSVRCS